MREERLTVRPFEDLRILEYSAIQTVNEHARAKVRGRIPFQRREDYMKAGKRQTWAQVVAISEGEESILFYGVIEQLQIEINDGTCTVELSLCSGTQLMDYEEHIRSFQEDGLTYNSLLDICSQKYEESARIMTEGKGRGIPESREIHKLGERRPIDGRDVFIWKIESALKGNELYHTCYMKTRSGFQAVPYNNKLMAGVSLLGRVTKVEDEKVQIKIHRDENKDKSGFCWYSFSTVYSSPDGTGWYCMPEIGDTVRLYFPTPKEEDAYVASAYHEGGAGLRTNPKCKFWRNKEGKEIQLAPDRILLTNNDGTYIELSDDEGIEIVSEGSVTVRAGGSLSITSSGSSIEMSAQKKAG